MDLDPQTETRVRLLLETANRTIVTALHESDRPLDVEALAERLVDHETGVVSAAEYDRRLEETTLSLHHDLLPRLAEADLIEYDRQANTAAYREPTAPEAEWHDLTPIDELLTHIPTSHTDDSKDGLKVITGRQSVIEYGRQLADEAEEELFGMYVSTDLLGDECIRRADQALDRGVTMYLGSQNREVRELTRKHLPEVTIWEPQLDLLNTPSYPRVGRLILIDRRKVMLAVLDEPGSDEIYPEEIAVAGEGEDHPLVVLVRELLGPRLDHLDNQSEDFRSEAFP